MSPKVYGCLPDAAPKLVRIPGINAGRIRFAKSTWIFTAMK